MNIALGSGRRLVLAGLQRWPSWLAAGLVALALLILLYRYERRLVPRRTGLALLALRLAAALALVAALFEPVAERIHREPLRGRLIVGVDLSESMATTDPGAPAPRRDVARRLLSGDWLKSARADHDVETIGFARHATPGPVEAIAELLARSPTPADRDAQATDWEPVLRAALASQDNAPTLGVVLLTDGRHNGPPAPDPALDRLKERGIPVYPVLIGSTAPPRDAAIAAVKAPETADRGQTARIDVTIKADGLPPGTEVPVTLEGAGSEPIRQTVRAQPDGGRPVVTFRVPFEETGQRELAVAVGPIENDARADNDRRPFKVTVADDKARVLVVDGEARWEFQYLRNALARDPRVTLEAVVLRQPTPPNATATFYPTALPPPPEPPADPQAPPPPDPLGAFDAIIVGDVGPDGLPAETWQRLERYVARRGGTLVLAAGPRSFPALARDHETVRDLLPLREAHVLPADPSATDPDRPALPGGLAILPTTVAVTGPWPMLQFADEPERTLAAWSALPKLPWVLGGTPKPAATVLATAGTPDDPAADAALAAMPYGLGKVLWVGTDATWRWRYRVGDAYHHRFWGQVVQWAARGKLTAGNRLVQFGPVPPRVPEGDPITIRARFTDSAPNITPTLLVAARIHANSSPTGPLPPGEGGRRPGEGGTQASPDDPPKPTAPNPPPEPLAVIPLRPRDDQPRTFEGQAPALPPGTYTVTLDVPQLADAMHAEGGDPSADLEITPRETPERIELAAARDPLDRLAAATGGRVFTPDQIDALPDLLRKRTVVRTRIEPTRLGERPEALILFFALLTAEWALRKRAGLP